MFMLVKYKSISLFSLKTFLKLLKPPGELLSIVEVNDLGLIWPVFGWGVLTGEEVDEFAMNSYILL